MHHSLTIFARLLIELIHWRGEEGMEREWGDVHSWFALSQSKEDLVYLLQLKYIFAKYNY